MKGLTLHEDFQQINEKVCKISKRHRSNICHFYRFNISPTGALSMQRSCFPFCSPARTKCVVGINIYTMRIRQMIRIESRNRSIIPQVSEKGENA